MKPENGNCNSSSSHNHLLGEKHKCISQNWSKIAKSVAISLTCCRLPAELSHWWGGRRGRTGGGGAILWGATDRDGMGGPGDGRQGSQRRGNSPPVTTPRHHTRTPPPTTTTFLSLFSSCRFTRPLTPLVYFPAMVDWPVHAFAGLWPPVGSSLQTQFVLFP